MSSNTDCSRAGAVPATQRTSPDPALFSAPDPTYYCEYYLLSHDYSLPAKSGSPRFRAKCARPLSNVKAGSARLIHPLNKSLIHSLTHPPTHPHSTHPPYSTRSLAHSITKAANTHCRKYIIYKNNIICLHAQIKYTK